MKTVRFMRFHPAESDPFYLVGTDIEAMRKTAKNADRSAGEGEQVSYELVLKSADTSLKNAILLNGIEATEAGRTTDYYLFCS